MPPWSLPVTVVAGALTLTACGGGGSPRFPPASYSLAPTSKPFLPGQSPTREPVDARASSQPVIVTHDLLCASPGPPTDQFSGGEQTRHRKPSCGLENKAKRGLHGSWALTGEEDVSAQKTSFTAC